MAAEAVAPDDLAVLRLLRSRPGSSVDAVAAGAFSQPKTNFGRQRHGPAVAALARLNRRGLVLEHDGRWRLTDRGRRTLAAVAVGPLEQPPQS